MSEENQILNGKDTGNIPPKEALRANLIMRTGVLFGVAATFLGGIVGAATGKVSKKFSPAQGFTGGAIILGAWTSALQAVNYFRITKAASNIPDAPTVSDAHMFQKDNYKAPDEEIIGDCQQIHQRSVSASRAETNRTR
jgi:hypothetical protein